MHRDQGDDLSPRLARSRKLPESPERRIGDRRRFSARTLVRGTSKARRRDARRTEDRGRTLIDWHESKLLYIAMAILLLGGADAVLTLNLMGLGAREVNGFMAVLIDRDVYWFAATKMALTGFGVLVLVSIARFRLFRRIQGVNILKGCFLAYVVLIIYEVVLLTIKLTA